MPSQIIGFSYGHPDKIDSFEGAVETLVAICQFDQGIE
jgi:hypothetical protein